MSDFYHEPPDSDPEQDAILETFHATGHRVTSQRLTLLHVMREQGSFLDAEELHRIATLHGEDLSLATVYRTLALFKEMGLVEGRIVGGEQDREEYRFRPLSETYTLVCKRCGAIVPVEPDIIDAFREEANLTLGVTILGAQACFIGYCADCTAILAAEADT
jgi:Fur family peroxide stress response transcriptional regulator